jgi:hypothetical protein
MTLQSAVIPGFNNGISQQAATNRRPNQGEIQINALGTLVDGLVQRPGTEHLAVLTSNATNGVLAHTINRDTDEQYVVFFTGDPSEPIENGGFDDADDWTISGTAWSIGSGVATADGLGTGWQEIYQDASIVSGKTYLITYTISNYGGSGSLFAHIGGVDGTERGSGGVGNGTYRDVITANGSNGGFRATEAFAGDIDNVSIVELDTTSIPSAIIKANTVADNTFVINRSFTVEITSDVNTDSLTGTVQTFADLPGSPSTGNVYKITGDDLTGFDDWYVKYDGSTWNQTIKPTESLGSLKDYTMPYRLVHTAATTFTFAPCIWEDREVGDVNSTPTPSFVGNTISNVFFFKNRLAFLSEDKVIMSRTGEYFNFYTQTALYVLDTDPIDVSATSKQVENLRSVAVFDKSLLLLADQQQFDFGSGDDNLTPTTVAITPTTRFNICTLCEPVTAGPNVYFVCPKTDNATIREYYIQPDSMLNDAADVTAHAPQYIPMGYIQMAACNSLDMLMVHSDAEPDAIYLYKYFWAGEEKAQASWSKWTFNGDVLSVSIIGTVAYFTISYDEGICLEKMELEVGVTGDLDFRVHLDRMSEVQGTYDPVTDKTTFTLPYDFDQFLGTTEIVDNGGFDSAVGWTLGQGWTISSGKAHQDGTQSGWADLQQYNSELVLGKTYLHTFTVSNYVAGIVCGKVGGHYGTNRTANGTYSEYLTPTNLGDWDVITGNADFIGSVDNVSITEVNGADHPFQFINPTTGRPILSSTAVPTTKNIVVDGDLSAETFYTGSDFTMSYRLTPWYLKNQDGTPKLQGRLQVRSLVLNFQNTGYFRVVVTPTGNRGTPTTHRFSGAVIGVSNIGEASLHDGEERFTIKSRNTRCTVDIVSDSYLPVSFQSGSWEGIYYPRGKE